MRDMCNVCVLVHACVCMCVCIDAVQWKRGGNKDIIYIIYNMWVAIALECAACRDLWHFFIVSVVFCIIIS